MKDHLLASIAFWAGAVPAVIAPAHAQSLPYDDVAGAPGGGEELSSDSDGADADPVADVSGDTGRHRKRYNFSPYIEAMTVVTGDITPGNEVLTYSTVAVGGDASIDTRRVQAGMAVRYERRFSLGSNKVQDSDVVTGIARTSVAVGSRALTIEGGAMATRTSVENNGSTVTGLEFGDSATQVYSAYIGPSVRGRVGDVAVEGHYRFGYNRVTSPNTVSAAPGQNPVDLFSDGTVHNAQIHVGTRAGEMFPVGIGAGGGWQREDSSNLDQRIDDKHVRGDVSLPITSDLAVVGGVGYEKVEVSNRDALIDSGTMLPVIDSKGRYVTDKSQPRQIAYESEGLIWDAGVVWRPSRRTALEAHVGRRYDSTTYFGSFAYAPGARTSINVSVYDSVNGFGGMLNNSLANLPTTFDALYNPLTGGPGTCVASVSGQAGSGTCLNGALASVRSSAFRGRGVMASVNMSGRGLQYGVAGGYDRRRFMAAPGTVLALANGVIDESYWLAGYLTGQIGRDASFGTNVWANWYQSGDALAGDSTTIGATASYSHTIFRGLAATAAVGVSGVEREQLEDIWSASAQLGLRYSF